MKTLFIFTLALFIATFWSCSQNDIETTSNQLIELDEKSAALVEADNVFGLELFQKIREESDEENIMISPLSISLALAMAYNGANGDTQNEMEQTMKLNGLTPEQINTSYKNLIAALLSLDEDVIFEIADAIFYKDDFSVKQNFIDINKNYYDAEVNALDFSNTSALETINSWVAEKTHDKIAKILDQLSPDDRMLLLNAIYFYGTWTNEFDQDGTKMLNFYFADGSNKEVAMMSKEDKLEYTSNNIFSAVKLPYGTGQYNMLILRPAEGETSQTLIDELSVDNWKIWNDNFETKDNVVITMPRFKFEYQLDLIPVLKEMGMQKAFSSSLADFSNISDIDLFISGVIHKSYIDVNETGTEAAAVTAIVFTTTSIEEPAQKIYFTVDKPFVFAITEKDTNAILFIGEVQNPQYEN